MFASFNDVFKSKSLREQKVPDVTLKYLSNSLPKGVKYVSDEHGNLTITSSDGSKITMGGFNVTITDEMRSVLGNQYSAAQIAKYAYNTQKKIVMNLKEDGIIIVNGERMPVEKFAYNMFDNFSYVNSKFYMVPPKFPEPFELELGCEKYKRKLSFQRVPYASLDKSKFQSVNEDPLRMEFIVCEEDYSVKMTLGFDLKKANTVKDIVETVFIYNAYCDGKGLLMGHPVGRTQDKADDKKFDEKSAQFWEKVLEIEEKLNLKFIPPKDDIEFETICLVEQLYQNLICKKPVKQREIITSIISDMNVKEGVNLDDLIGKQIFFQYNATTTFELFEKEFSLPAILGIFNSTFKSYEILDDNKTKIILGIKDKNLKPFTAILCFASDSDLNEYVKENPDCYENILSNAKFPQDYLE